MKTATLQLRLSEDENFEGLIREGRNVLKCTDATTTFLKSNTIVVTFFFKPTDEMEVDCFVQMMEDQFDTLKRVK